MIIEPKFLFTFHLLIIFLKSVCLCQVSAHILWRLAVTCLNILERHSSSFKKLAPIYLFSLAVSTGISRYPGSFPFQNYEDSTSEFCHILYNHSETPPRHTNHLYYIYHVACYWDQKKQHKGQLNTRILLNCYSVLLLIWFSALYTWSWSDYLEKKLWVVFAFYIYARSSELYIQIQKDKVWIESNRFK